jgi:hypothetical protein
MLKDRLQSLVRMSQKRKQVWTTLQFASLSQLEISNLQDLEKFTSIVNLLNAGPCSKNCLFNVLHKTIKRICKQRVCNAPLNKKCIIIASFMRKWGDKRTFGSFSGV